MSDILWTPPAGRAAASRMAAFLASAPGSPSDYEELWRWSVDDLDGFWGKVWDDCGVIAQRRYDQVHGDLRMPGTSWFPGARLNLAENLLRRDDDGVALVGAGEGRDDELVTWAQLHGLVAAAQRGLAEAGVGVGDRVAAVLPNCIEAVVLAAATLSLGAVWSSCSPDFGAQGVVDRFGQIEPTVLCVADGYRYGGRTHALQEKVDGILAALSGVAHVVVVGFADTPLDTRAVPSTTYADLVVDARPGDRPRFEPLPPDHPVYILYSSGTTGVPKSIVHGAAGVLLMHLKEHQLHSDVQPDRGDVLTWFTTCGWMMWNWLVSGLASGLPLVLYDGSPTMPDIGVLWRLAERHGVTHFGTSPRYLAGLEKAGARPADLADLSRITTVMSTGSPLNPDQFDWVYANVSDDIHLASVSGGTDLIGCFVGGNPLLPVRRGELQCRSLGMAVEAWDDEGRPVIGQKGELVCTRPFPSMPVGFWNDEDGSRYRKAYYAQHPGVWTHGDFIEIRPHGGAVIYGRSDTTLNPGGVRIGTAEIYRAIEPLPEVVDAIVVGRDHAGDVEVVLCVRLAEGITLDDELVARIRTTIRSATTPRHVPAHVFAVADVPYTISGKKVEKAVRSMIAGEPVDNRDALGNPEALDEYARLPFPR